VYATADDRWIAVSGTTDAQVARLLPLLGRDTDADRARFGTSSARLAVADELDRLVASWVATQASDDALAGLLAARIPAAPVNDLSAILGDPHVVARRSIVTVADDILGPVHMPAPFPRLVSTPGRIRSPAPALGAHTAEVLAEWLGTEEPGG
jgi:crotonobetainyl-CoA:carnitine CoA-transferase CaiB-like acyl-CoA transferase